MQPHHGPGALRPDPRRSTAGADRTRSGPEHGGNGPDPAEDTAPSPLRAARPATPPQDRPGRPYAPPRPGAPGFGPAPHPAPGLAPRFDAPGPVAPRVPPSPMAPGPGAPPGPGMPPAPPPESSQSAALSVLWSLAPLFSCGTATPFTMGYAAARLRSKALARATIIYSAIVAFFMTAVGANIHIDSDLVEFLLGAGMVGSWLGGTAHSFAIRRKVFGLDKEPNDRALAYAQHRRALREKAREIVANDPSLARELRIGRPDLPRQYDDGGLIDLNHAPIEVLVTLPGVTWEMAERIVAAREASGGFISAEDAALAADLPANIVADLAEYTVYLP